MASSLTKATGIGYTRICYRSEMFSKLLIATAGSALAAMPAAAQPITLFSGDTTGKPAWSRPFAGTPPTGINPDSIPYEATEFYVDTAGIYTIITDTLIPSTANWDGYLFLYDSSFDPTQPLVGALTGNDDTGFTPTFPGICAGNTSNSRCSQVMFSLAANTSYFIVQTGFSSGNFGVYNASIDGGPGTAFIGSPTFSQPVPAPLPVLGASAAFTTSRRLRKRLVKHSR